MSYTSWLPVFCRELANVAELVDAPDLGSGAARCESSSLSVRTISFTQEVALVDAVHGAMTEALKLPPNDRTVRLVVHEPHRFACPPNKQLPEFYTHITIDMFSGRSREVKRALYAEVVSRLERLGIPRDHVIILLRESPQENWGVRGGQPACDVDLGFKVEI